MFYFVEASAETFKTKQKKVKDDDNRKSFVRPLTKS